MDRDSPAGALLQLVQGLRYAKTTTLTVAEIHRALFLILQEFNDLCTLPFPP
jgi:hypothetical protein